MIQNYSISNVDFILISVCLLLFILTIVFFILFLHNRTKKKNYIKNTIELKNELTFQKDNLDQTINKYKNLNEHLKNEIEKYLGKVSNIAELSVQDAKEILIENIEELYEEELSKKIIYLKEQNHEKINEISSNILINSMEKILQNVIAKTSSNISVDEEMKGKLVGKNGSMIHLFEKVTSANIRIEKDVDVIISCFNPLKREIAIRTLKALLLQSWISQDNIYKVYKSECKKINSEMIQIGKKTVEETLKLKNYIPEGLYYYIGRLYYRTSFSQSALTHSIECAIVSSSIAEKLGLDSTKAKLCGFLHDIGKSVDYEEGGNHVESGLKLAEKFDLPNYVINTIHSHHGDIKADNTYAVIAKMADTISASRPGIRKSDTKEHFERVESIEKICKSFKGVNNAYVIKSGRVVKVIIDAKIINNDKINILEKKLLSKFNENKLTLNVPIKIVIIRDRNG